MFFNAAEFDQCLLDTSFPGDADGSSMFVGTAGASYNPVSDLSDSRCPTAAPTSSPHAPAYSTRQRLHFFDYQKLSLNNEMKKFPQPSQHATLA